MVSLLVAIWAPLYLGTIFNVLLYGIMILQTFLYFTVYKKDPLWIKAYVAVLFLCDTLNCAFDVALVYLPFIQQYGNISALENATWLSAADPAMTSIIALLVQFFFAWRIKVLTNNWPIVLVIVACSVAQWCGGVGTGIGMGTVTEYIELQRLRVVISLWLAASAVTDLIITIALVRYLKVHKTGWAHTDNAINRVIRLTVQTGMITATCAIIDLIAFLATPTGLHLVFNLPLSKLYTNSLMSSLNTRAGWGYDLSSRHQTVARFNPSNSGISTIRSDLGSGGHSDGNSKDHRRVVIDVETIEMTDRCNDNKSSLTKESSEQVLATV